MNYKVTVEPYWYKNTFMITVENNGLVLRQIGIRKYDVALVIEIMKQCLKQK